MKNRRMLWVSSSKRLVLLSTSKMSTCRKQSNIRVISRQRTDPTRRQHTLTPTLHNCRNLLKTTPRPVMFGVGKFQPVPSLTNLHSLFNFSHHFQNLSKIRNKNTSFDPLDRPPKFFFSKRWRIPKAHIRMYRFPEDRAWPTNFGLGSVWGSGAGNRNLNYHTHFGVKNTQQASCSNSQNVCLCVRFGVHTHSAVFVTSRKCVYVSNTTRSASLKTSNKSFTPFARPSPSLICARKTT